MEAQRSDAARNRTRILEAARAAAAAGGELSLNAIARAADVGTGTVYRHFPTAEALEEVLVWDRFDELGERLRIAEPDHLESVLLSYFASLVDDAMFERVTSRQYVALENTDILRRDLIGELERVLQRNAQAGRIRDDLSASDLLALLCGLAHSARALGLSLSSPRAQRMFGLLMDGLKAGARKRAS